MFKISLANEKYPKVPSKLYENNERDLPLF